MPVVLGMVDSVERRPLVSFVRPMPDLRPKFDPVNDLLLAKPAPCGVANCRPAPEHFYDIKAVATGAGLRRGVTAHSEGARPQATPEPAQTSSAKHTMGARFTVDKWSWFWLHTMTT